MTVHSTGLVKSRVNELSVEVHNQQVKASFLLSRSRDKLPLELVASTSRMNVSFCISVPLSVPLSICNT
jgi:hypothetical protein